MNIIVNVMSVGKHVYYFMLIRGNFFVLDNQMQIRLSPDRYMERLILTDVKNYWDQTIALCAT